MMGMSLIKDESTVVMSNANGVSFDVASVAVLEMGMSHIKNRSTAEWDRKAGRAPTRTLRGSGVVRDPLSRGASRRGDRRAGRRWLAMTGQTTG